MTGNDFGRRRVRREQLGNGLRVVTAEQADARSVALRVITKTGSAFETPAEQGLAHFVEHMLFQGTDRYPTFSAIGRAIEALGGIINGGTDRLKTTYWVKVLPEHCAAGFELLSDLIQHSRFAPEDIERERSVISEEIHRRHDRPDEYVNSLLARALWPDQPLGRETLGKLETVRSFTRDDLLGYHQTRYVAADIVVAAAGAVRHDEIVTLAERNLSGLPVDLTRILPTGSFGPGSVIEVDTRPTAQIHLAMGFPAIGREDPRIHAARLLVTVLGRGIGSRLFLAVRQRLGLAYSIGADLHDLVNTGSLEIRAGIKPSGIREAMEAIVGEVRELHDKAPGAEDTNRAKEIEKSRLLFMLESDDAVAERIGTQELLLGRIIPIEQDISAYDAARSEDLAEVAQEVLDLAKLKIAAIGEVEKADMAVGQSL